MTPSVYRKRPFQVFAMRFEGIPPDNTNIGDVVKWVIDQGGDAVARNKSGDGLEILIETLEGTMRAQVGDWIIRGVQGEFYPVRSDIFDQTYEPVVT